MGVGTFGWSNQAGNTVLASGLNQFWTTPAPVGYSPTLLSLGYENATFVDFAVTRGSNGQVLTTTLAGQSLTATCFDGAASGAFVMLVQLQVGANTVIVGVVNNVISVDWAGQGFTANGTFAGLYRFADKVIVGTPTAAMDVSLITVGPEGSPTVTGVLQTTDSTLTFGSPTDTWGIASFLTAAQLNSVNFGVNLQASIQMGTGTFDISGVSITAFLANGESFTAHAGTGANAMATEPIETPWSNPNNIAANTPGIYASVTMTGPAFSEFLVATNFNFSIPSLPTPLPSFNYIKTFEDEGVFDYTLVLGSDGIMYQEDVLNNPGVLVPVYDEIIPGSFAQSNTIDGREFIAISDLLMGTDIPLTYNGTNFDRCSQVGPGAPPTASATTAGSTVLTITQNPAHAVPVNAHSFLLVSASPRDQGSFGLPNTPGNVLTVIFDKNTPLPPEITPGSNVVLTGFPDAGIFRINNDPTGVLAPEFYTVTSTGAPIPGQDSYDAFTVTVPFTTFFNEMTPPGAMYQSTLATLTTATQVPNLEVGDQFSLSGTGGAPPAGYDSTWTVLQTPNASQLQITATGLLNNVATYSYNLVTGTAPTVGEAVSVFQTLNGNGIFNISNAIITAAGVGTFSVSITGANVPTAAEDGAGIVFGTIFIFDAFAIIGNKMGGEIIITGIIAAGIRGICYSFLTRNGYVTAPSPIAMVDITEGAASIAIANLLPGPPNVIARIIHLTPANGGQFYNIPEPVPVTTITGTVINSSTYVRDNTSTQATLSFADGVLVSATEIDVQGNNLFETVELGAPVGFLPFGDRMFAIGEENKVSNFVNWSFDGGIAVIGSAGGATGTYPAGWTVDKVNGAGGSMVGSPKFGFSYEIFNNTGVTQPLYGMITQPAFQDEFLVAIIQPSTAYSARITAQLVTGPPTGNLVGDLFSPSIGKVLGDFTIPLSALSAAFLSIQTGEILNQVLAPVPNDLQLRLYATGIGNGTSVLIDRFEVFPTEEPTLSTQIIGSYIENFEAFDQVTGALIASIQNQQPVKSAFTLYDNMYIVKSRSLLSTADNGTTEPSGWTTRVVSNVVGTESIYGVDSGEDWALICGQPGLYIFDGGQPTKLSSEIQKLWNLINWKYGHTLWVKNDIVNQRILVGVPMKTASMVNGVLTQNPWIPAGVIPDNTNPTTPNIILMMNYKELNTGSGVAERIAVHASSFTGKLIATDVTRKWAIWTIQAPAAAYVTRPDTTQELFLGNSMFTGKIYQLIDNLYQDDGVPMWQIYYTYAFPSPEQAEQFQIGNVQKQFLYGRSNIDGAGDLTITAAPNVLNGPYAHALLPTFPLPAQSNGDLEFPVNEVGERMFVGFSTFAIGAGFRLSNLAIAIKAHSWAPVRGVNR